MIVPQTVLTGQGTELISTPAESILLVLPPARAGVGSMVDDATRELGGTPGVAVVGSLFSSVFATSPARRTPTSCRVLSPRPRTRSGPRRRWRARTPDSGDAMRTAFMDGFTTSCVVVGPV